MTEANMNATKVCPKCEGQMERGGLRGNRVSVWGHIKESTIFGTKVRDIVSPLYTLEAYRCQQCGFIEMYAVNEQVK